MRQEPGWRIWLSSVVIRKAQEGITSPQYFSWELGPIWPQAYTRQGQKSQSNIWPKNYCSYPSRLNHDHQDSTNKTKFDYSIRRWELIEPPAAIISSKLKVMYTKQRDMKTVGQAEEASSSFEEAV